MSYLSRIIKSTGRLYRQMPFQIAMVTLFVICFASAGVYYFESRIAGPNIQSLWDSIWWAVVTMGTVGYGDKYPVSAGGRIVGLVLIVFGVGLMSLFTATIASIFVERRMKEGRGLETVKEKNHIVICGWNEHTEDVLKGLTMYGSMGDTPIVLINELPVDDIESLRLKYHKYSLKFLRGDYIHEEILQRAGIARAKFALIMADISGGRSKGKVDERTILATLTIKSISPQVKTIAEILDHENRPHLKRAGVDEIIIRGEHIGSLLASAINSPGLPRVFSSIISLGDTNKLWRVNIPRSFIGKSFQELSVYFRKKQHAILIGLVREKQAMKLEDLLSDNTSAIDKFIRDKIKESKKEFFYERDESKAVINPDDDYIVGPDDFAVILSKTMPDKI
jgi:voltage-gated potassium channel